MPPEKSVRYFEWDYGAKTLTEYERDGECNECGACCITRIQWVYANGKDWKVLDGWSPKNGDKYNGKFGVVTEVRIGDRSRYFHNIEITSIIEPCKQLTADKRCRIHLGKSLLAREWPMSPRHVTPFAECSYTFREIFRATFAELGLDENGDVVSAT